MSTAPSARRGAAARWRMAWTSCRCAADIACRAQPAIARSTSSRLALPRAFAAGERLPLHVERDALRQPPVLGRIPAEGLEPTRVRAHPPALIDGNLETASGIDLERHARLRPDDGAVARR